MGVNVEGLSWTEETRCIPGKGFHQVSLSLGERCVLGGVGLRGLSAVCWGKGFWAAFSSSGITSVVETNGFLQGVLRQYAKEDPITLRP